jgi:hypothetical protein
MLNWFKKTFTKDEPTEKLDAINEEDLKKTGFDPTEIETEDIQEEPFCEFG